MSASQPSLQRRMRPLLGTFVEVAGEGPRALVAIEQAFTDIARVQRALSFQQADSELSRLNARPQQWCALSPLATRVLRIARAMSAASNHRFNCTVGGELVLRGALPDHGGDFLPCGQADDIQLDRGRVRLGRPVRITLDGIAKGYAVDCAITALKRAGMQSGWVNAGGDIRVFGDRPLPVSQRAPDGNVRPLGSLSNAALATSQTGSAAALAGQLVVADREPGEAAVFSVMARFAWRADALTKVAANAPPAERARLVQRLGGWLVTNPEEGDH